MRFRLGVLSTHPIQYYAPWFRYLAKRLDLQVFYAHRQDATGQAEAGFNVEFDWDVPLLDGYPYHWLTNVSRRPGLRTFRGLDTPELYQLIRKERFDAFLVFGWNHKNSLQAIRACWQTGVPVFMRGDSHLMTRRSLSRSVIKYLPYRWFLPRLDAHLYVGQRNRDYLQHYGVSKDQLFFVPHFVDNAFFAEASQDAKWNGKNLATRMAAGIPDDGFVFLFVGKMTPIKRTIDFIQACLRIMALPEGRNVHALLVGDGPLRESLERVGGARDSRIHFAGFRNQAELPAYYAASDALVLPSGAETWGLVVNEAFACGIPAVVSDTVGCAPDLIEEGRTGYTYPAGDVGRLACRMLDLKASRERAPEAIPQALAGKVARYSIERASEGLERALEMVTMKRSGSSLRIGAPIA